MSLFVFWLLPSFPVGAEEPTPLQALQKMQKAMELLNFQGTVAFLRSGKLDTLKYFHASLDGKDQERLVSLNSPLHEVIRDAEKISCFMESSAKVVVDHRPQTRSFLIDLPEITDGMDAIYDMKFSGEERVAMQSTLVLDVKPRDKYRYPRRIWIEKDQYLPLKSEVYSGNNEVLEQVVFTDLELKNELPIVNAEAAMAQREIKHIHEREPMPFSEASFETTRVPPGFKEQFFIKMNLSEKDKPVEHLLLTDGFSSVSVYLENKSENMELGAKAAGAVNSFSKIIGNYLVTVMGEVPAENVLYISEGVKLKGNLK